MEGSEELNWGDSNRRTRAFELPTSAVSSTSHGGTGFISRESTQLQSPIIPDIGTKHVAFPYTKNVDHPSGSSKVNKNEAMLGAGSGDTSLRQWLDDPNRSVDLMECLHIFKQIVEIVNVSHEQGVVVHNIRPSCLVLSSYNRVSFMESASCSSSKSESSSDEGLELYDHTVGGGEQSSSFPGTYQLRSLLRLPVPGDSFLETSRTTSFHRDLEGNYAREVSMSDARTLSNARPEYQHGSPFSSQGPLSNENRSVKIGGKESGKKLAIKQILVMELDWYTSPEESSGSSSSFVSDIYRLGVLLFELFSTYISEDEKFRTMSNLRHRVLPPQLLLRWPKEASFCLWLLHPRPTARPKMSEVLQSEFLAEPRKSIEDRQATVKIREEIEEQELLLEFLLQAKQRKQDILDKLQEVVCCLSTDIEEVHRQMSYLKSQKSRFVHAENDNRLLLDSLQPLQFSIGKEDETSTCSGKHIKSGGDVLEIENDTGTQSIIMAKSSRLMKNFKKVEVAYFLTRFAQMKPPAKVWNRSSSGSSAHQAPLSRLEGSNLSSVDNLGPKEGQSGVTKGGWINPFLEGLCRYLSYSKLKVMADLKQGDFLNSSNLVCSLSFDRDKEFFATAGVNKKIKIFECDMILNGSVDIHYPVIEMTSRSKLSCVCWNTYIKNQIASSDFEGVVQVWDATRGQVFMDLREHERRVWCVDFSQADPTRLASGSDDGCVKLWNTNQGSSVGTIKTKANVCCVQFPPNSARFLAVGSADHKIYCYDLRNTRQPWCTLMSHTKTVSYIRFVDSTTLVSASTDNTLKLWDLSASSSRFSESPIQTFTGHTNVKNFVGLSVSDGYIATGSETNEVVVYYKDFPMPVLEHKFTPIDQTTGQAPNDGSQFVSCVSWRGQSNNLVAANSTGNVQILEMV